MAQGIDPGMARREEKHAKEKAALNTFEAVARAWLARTAGDRAASTQEKNTAWFERNIFPANSLHRSAPSSVRYPELQSG
ncbi:hypothetical protein GCM10025794_21110 [Massilia kyonggiensis]